MLYFNKQGGNMKGFKIKYKDETFKIVIAKNALEVIKKYDLCTKENISTKVIELLGEQKAIAFSNINNKQKRIRK
jgi:hypothetical protein